MPTPLSGIHVRVSNESGRAMEWDAVSKASEIRSLAKTLQDKAAATSLHEYRDKFLGAALGLIAAAEALESAVSSN